MDGKGEVYSTKRGQLGQLLGSRTPSGIYLTLNKRTYQKSQLQRQAMAHRDFRLETAAPTVAAAVPAATAPVKRAHAATLAEGIAKRGWVIAKVALVNDGPKQVEALLFGSKPPVHLTAESVNDELKRLATLNPGVKYVKLKVEGGLVLGGMTAL
jgi:hypothetical protein